MEGISWRHVYLFSVPLVLIFFILAVVAKYPDPADNFPRENGAGSLPENDKGLSAGNEPFRKNPAREETGPAGGISFTGALRIPIVWLFGLILGLMLSTEMATSNWGGLYFQDVYGMDPTTAGASFVSGFFILFTLSRLVSGFIIEKIGYIKSLTGAVFITGAIFIAGFALGRTGIYVLPVLGFFIAIFWPTIIAVAIRLFGVNAPVMTSAIIAIAGLFNALMQLSTGYINRYIGAAWGYRSCLIFTVALIALLPRLGKTVKRKA
jgi:fucose permease